MAKITRVVQKLFGSTAGVDEVGVFGSLAAGTPTTTTNPVTIQSLSRFLSGWFQAVIGNNSPAIEDMNALFFLAFYQIAYIFQAGIPEWETNTIYFIGSRVNYGGIIYTSITDNNTGNTPPDVVNWSVSLGAYDAIVGSAAQVTAGQATHSTWASAIAAVAAGSTIRGLPGTWVENVTLTKQVQIEGSGYGSYINGTFTTNSSTSNSTVSGLRLNGDFTLNSGSNGCVVKNIFFPTSNTFQDSGIGNLLEGIQA